MEKVLGKIGLLTLLGLVIGADSETFALNFKVVHEAIVECSNKGTDELQFRWKLNKVNRTLQTMHGRINFLRDFDDSMAIRAKLWSWKNGGWKAGTGLDFKKDAACSSMIQVLGPPWKEICQHAHINVKCPMKKASEVLVHGCFQGNYTLDAVDAKVWDKLPLPGAPINKYKLQFTFETQDGTVRGCYSSIFRVSKK